MLTRKNYMDKVQVKVELLDGSLLESYGALEELRREIQANIRRICQLDMEITLVSPNTLKRFEGKAPPRDRPAQSVTTNGGISI